jgi:hypothetical protein
VRGIPLPVEPAPRAAVPVDAPAPVDIQVGVAARDAADRTTVESIPFCPAHLGSFIRGSSDVYERELGWRRARKHSRVPVHSAALAHCPRGVETPVLEPETQCGDSSARRGHLERVLRVYVDHYDTHRPHRVLKLTPPMPRRRPHLVGSHQPALIQRRDRRRTDPRIRPGSMKMDLRTQDAEPGLSGRGRTAGRVCEPYGRAASTVSRSSAGSWWPASERRPAPGYFLDVFLIRRSLLVGCATSVTPCGCCGCFAVVVSRARVRVRRSLPVGR